jgi:hypothetical protein
MSLIPGSFITMLVPRGSSKPEWLARSEARPEAELLKP